MCCREATLLTGFEWVIHGSRQTCFVRAPAGAFAHTYLINPADPAAPAAVKSADPDSIAAAVVAAAYFSASVTSVTGIAGVICSFVSVAIIKGLEWAVLRSRQVYFRFGFIVFRGGTFLLLTSPN